MLSLTDFQGPGTLAEELGSGAARKVWTMEGRYVLTEYVAEAMAHAEYDKLGDETFSGRIPPCKGVIAFGASLKVCEDGLRSTLEDWILLALKMGHPLPVISEIDLNEEPTRAAVDTL